MITDSAVLWTYSRMIEKTEIYCKYHTEYYEQLGKKIEGWFMSKLALDDVIRFECLN